MVTEDSLVSRSSEFKAAIQNGERSSLRVLCDRKSQESVYVTGLTTSSINILFLPGCSAANIFPFSSCVILPCLQV